jgi:hypothetical protein
MTSSSSMCATCLAHPALLDLINLILYDIQQILLYFLHTVPVSFAGSNVLFCPYFLKQAAWEMSTKFQLQKLRDHSA